jgi:hypothetical protein
LGPFEDAGDRLRARRPDEDCVFAVAGAQLRQAGLDPSVEVADRLPVLRDGDERGVTDRQRPGVPVRLEPCRILQRPALRPL